MDGQFVQMTFEDYFSELQKAKMMMPTAEKEAVEKIKIVPEKRQDVSDSFNEKSSDDGRTIQDFGEKIGGAKKDLWRERGLLVRDLLEMNDAEQDKYIKKDNVWQKVDYEELVRNGLPIRVAYYIKKVRDALPTKPIITYTDKTPADVQRKREGYVEFISAFRDALMALKTESDMLNFYSDFVVAKGYIDDSKRYSVTPTEKCFDCFGNKLFKNIKLTSYSLSKMDDEIKRKEFCYTKEQSMMKDFEVVHYSDRDHSWDTDYSGKVILKRSVGSGRYFYYPKDSFADKNAWVNDTYYVMDKRTIISTNHPTREDALEYAKKIGSLKQSIADKKADEDKKEGKKRFSIKGLEYVRPSACNDYRKGKDVNGEDYLETFNFRGGEFGNWLNDGERQENLNFGYDAFMDLADALQIEPTDISLGGRLSIAFGARGSGSAMAHYEPLREVINLTKMKGAGSLAHEWGHALDNILCATLGEKGFLTDLNRNIMLASLKDLVQVMKYKEAGSEELEKAHKDGIASSENIFIRYVKVFLSDNRLSEEQLKRRDDIVAEMIKDSPNVGYAWDLKQGDNKGLDELNALYKEITGRVIPKKEREMIMNAQHHLGTAMTNRPTEMRVETQFYKDSKRFDDLFAKQDKGYWQSTVEMFARAFSCYVYDKIGGSGKDDYLCAHSNIHHCSATDRSGNEIVLYAYPTGKERKTINEHFDMFISECKELGLLHHRDVEIRQEKSSVKKSKAVSHNRAMEQKREMDRVK